MASNTGFLSTSELDFSSLRNNLKTYLQNQSQFTDYNFEGSNMGVLLDILTYNTYLNSFYLNMVGSEMFLDTAQLKESVVSHAKELNYIPRSKTSAVAYVDVTINTGTASPNFITIPKNYAFTTTIDNVKLSYLVPSDIIVIPVGGVYRASNVAIYEGKVVSEYYTVSESSKYVLSSENLDSRSVEVIIYESNTDTVGHTYSLSSSLFGLTPTSNVFFIQGYSDNKYEIVFGNGVSGRKLNTGNIVRVDYRDTVGDLGNGAYVFAKTSLIDGFSGISVGTVSAASEGSERETTNSIRFNAPRYFSTQERCVTASDYINLTKARYTQLQSVNAFGGEELDPPQYGKVAISVKPYGSTAIISNFLKNDIVKYLTEKNLTIEPIIVDPEFFYIRTDSTVVYDNNLTNLSTAQIRTLAENAILNYGNENLAEFGDDVRYSKLISNIDNAEPSIISNDTDLYISKRISPTNEVQFSTSFSFDNELYSELNLYKLPQGHELVVFSSSFNYKHTDGLIYTAYIGDDGLGELFIYTDLLVQGRVTRTPLTSGIGKVDYATGSINFALTTYSYSGNYISIYSKPKNKDIFANKNKFLIIDARDVNVTVNTVNG